MYIEPVKYIPMPIVRPVPMRTRGKSFFIRMLLWLFTSRTWELMETYTLSFVNPRTQKRMTLLVPKGFICDFASVPKMFWPLLSPTGILLLGALFHDFGYRYGGVYVQDRKNLAYYFTPMSKSALDTLFQDINIWSTAMVSPIVISKITLALFGFVAWRKSRKAENNAVQDFGLVIRA